jgi:hypothetical protein
MQQIGWDDVPHITDHDKAEMLEAYPAHQRDARAKGIPMLGAGAIYPIDEKIFTVEPFKIPDWWPRAYGFDVGWKRTAAIWGAHDRETDTVYLYAEYYQGQRPPQLHADAIKGGGALPGAIDPASAGASQKDGTTLLDEYRQLGLELYPADNAVEAGIMAITRRLESGRLKVFATLRNWFAEFRLYRRVESQTERGLHVHIVKENDHLMDASRYLLMTGMRYARFNNESADTAAEYQQARRSSDSVTGY